jgi:hypothetical protein
MDTIVDANLQLRQHRPLMAIQREPSTAIKSCMIGIRFEVYLFTGTSRRKSHRTGEPYARPLSYSGCKTKKSMMQLDR